MALADALALRLTGVRAGGVSWVLRPKVEKEEQISRGEEDVFLETCSPLGIPEATVNGSSLCNRTHKMPAFMEM